MAKIGIIGIGNMGSAILKGLLHVYEKEEIIFTDVNRERCAQIEAETGVHFAESNVACANQAKYVLLAVKPQYFDPVLKNISNVVTEKNVIISIAPGITVEQLKEKLGIEKERNHRALVDADAIHKAYQILRCRILGIANIDQHAFDEAPLEEMGADTVGMVDARSRRNIHLVVAVVFGLMTVSALYGSLVNGMPLGSALIGAVITLIAVRNMVKQSKRLASISHKDEEDSPFK